MQYYIEKPKQVFTYKTDDGLEHSNINADYINKLALDDESRAFLFKKITKFYNQLEYFEKKWRNRQLTNTDWLMVEDATFGGQEIRDSIKFEEIKTYRKSLRNYKPKEEDRPIKPDWL